jgi:hypothetical protein
MGSLQISGQSFRRGYLNDSVWGNEEEAVDRTPRKFNTAGRSSRIFTQERTLRTLLRPAGWARKEFEVRDFEVNPWRGLQMLRRSLVALLLGVIGAGDGFAGDTPARTQAAPGIIGWFRNRSDSQAPPQSGSKRKSGSVPGGVERAVVRDAEKQSVVKKTSGGQQDRRATRETTAESAEFPLVRPQVAAAAGPVSQTTPVSSGRVLPVAAGQAGAAAATAGAPVNTGYPQTGASLYPAPRPGIPWQVGGTSVANPALQPHEMLYGHHYRALYGPYYYQVHGHWMVTPFGVWSQEDWRLKGTEVDVRYRTSVSPFSLFVPPALR